VNSLPRIKNTQRGIGRAIRDPLLFANSLGNLESWETWISTLKASRGEPLTSSELARFHQVSGGVDPPTSPCAESWHIAGRRSGKSRMAALAGSYLATCIDYRARLAPGEVAYVLIISPTMDQSQTVFGYCRAFLEDSPLLSRPIESMTTSEIRLTREHRVVIACHPASYRSVRGRSLCAAILDESSMFRSEDSAQPDIEILRALEPSLMPGAPIIGIGTPYRQTGVLFERFRDYFGKPVDDILVVRAPTLVFNPSYDRKKIARAHRTDPESAQAEWEAIFRSDLQALLDEETVQQAVNHNRPFEIPPREFHTYRAFGDPGGGRGDAYTLCIGHMEGERFVADVVRGRTPPYDPNEVTKEFADLCREYRCSKLTTDNYSAGWVESAVQRAGLTHALAENTKSELYLAGLPMWVRGNVDIPNLTILIREARSLERRTTRSGRDLVDHGRSGSDDFINSVFGCISLCASSAKGAWMSKCKDVLNSPRMVQSRVLRRSPNSTGAYSMRQLAMAPSATVDMFARGGRR
jgi:hypothetical protein